MEWVIDSIDLLVSIKTTTTTIEDKSFPKSFILYIKAADDLVTQGAKASAVMVLT